MIEAFKHLDTLNGFIKLHKAWLTENEESWHSAELKKSLDRINAYVDQLASYISQAHNDIDVQIDVDYNYLRGKQFATIIKRTDEWKALKKWSKTHYDFDNQPVSVEALLRCIIQETKAFIRQV